MDGVVQDVCRALGVHFEESQPRHELYKLLVYETGSHFLAHQEFVHSISLDFCAHSSPLSTEKTPGMFATIVVILPSRFSGGELHLSHGGLSSVIDHSDEKSIGTSVASWYTDVMHEVKPVTSGYRLALAYNLFHTTNALRPSVSQSLHDMKLLRHVLLSWQQNLAVAPKKIVYLLNHTYAQASLKGSALKGQDAHLVALLDSLSKECQIAYGLASVECVVSGVADDEGGRFERDGWNRRKGYWNDSDDSDAYEDDYSPSNPGMAEVEERSVAITGLVDMEGTMLLDKVLEQEQYYSADEDEESEEYSLRTESIPANLYQKVEAGPLDKDSYEGYQGNVGFYPSSLYCGA